MLDILVPVLGRPHRVEPLVANIAATTDVPHRVLFVCSADDRAEIAAVEAVGADYLILDAPPARGQYAKKINLGYRSTSGERLFLGADDLHFHSGWATVALKFPQAVVATNDLGNYFVRQGLLATHSVISRSYIEVYGGSLSGPGSIYHEGYSHNFVDCELSVLARSRRQFAYARQAIVKHMHPVTGRAPMDKTYRAGMRHFNRDQRLFVRRMADYHSDRLVRRHLKSPAVRARAARR